MNLEQKYREGVTLTAQDAELLKVVIVTSQDVSELESYIYIFGDSFPKQRDVQNKIDKILSSDLVPGLTAVCLSVATEFWGQTKQKYLDLIASFIDYSLYEDWYDEVNFSASYAKRRPGIVDEDVKLIYHLRQSALADGNTDLIDLLS